MTRTALMLACLSSSAVVHHSVMYSITLQQQEHYTYIQSSGGGQNDVRLFFLLRIIMENATSPYTHTYHHVPDHRIHYNHVRYSSSYSCSCNCRCSCEPTQPNNTRQPNNKRRMLQEHNNIPLSLLLCLGFVPG